MNCKPALLALGLSNGHFMTCRLRHSNTRTLHVLNKGCGHFFDALALLQKGDLEYMARRGVVARHRDQGLPWQDCQPRFYHSLKEVQKEARKHHVMALFVFLSPTSEGWIVID